MDEAEICNQVAIIDGGKIVAHDTPANLKKRYTSTTMKIKTSAMDDLKQYLTERSIKYNYENDQVTVYATSTADVLDISNTFRESIEDIEINKGTLNDVFIAITGKEIRE
jgi:ABC-2 type transport system ATP-binding protein